MKLGVILGWTAVLLGAAATIIDLWQGEGLDFGGLAAVVIGLVAVVLSRRRGEGTPSV